MDSADDDRFHQIETELMKIHNSYSAVMRKIVEKLIASGALPKDEMIDLFTSMSSEMDAMNRQHGDLYDARLPRHLADGLKTYDLGVSFTGPDT